MTKSDFLDKLHDPILLGYNQKEFADYPGMHYSMVRRLINNKSKKREMQDLTPGPHESLAV